MLLSRSPSPAPQRVQPTPLGPTHLQQPRHGRGAPPPPRVFRVADDKENAPMSARVVTKPAAGAMRSANASAVPRSTRSLSGGGSGKVGNVLPFARQNYPAARAHAGPSLRQYEVREAPRRRASPSSPAASRSASPLAGPQRALLVSLSPPTTRAESPLEGVLVRCAPAPQRQMAQAEILLLAAEEELSRCGLERGEVAAWSTLREALHMHAVRYCAGAALHEAARGVAEGLWDAWLGAAALLHGQCDAGAQALRRVAAALVRCVETEAAQRAAGEAREAIEWATLTDAKGRALRTHWRGRGPSVALRLTPAMGALRLIGLPAPVPVATHDRVRPSSVAAAHPVSGAVGGADAQLQERLREAEARHTTEMRHVLTQMMRRERDLVEARHVIQRLQQQQQQHAHDGRPPLGKARAATPPPPPARTEDEVLLLMQREKLALAESLGAAQRELRRLAADNERLNSRVQSLLMDQAKACKAARLDDAAALEALALARPPHFTR